MGSTGRPSIKLSPFQTETLALLRAKIAANEYCLEEASCPCGAPAGDSVRIVEQDRYGLAVGAFLCNACGLLSTSPRLSQASLVPFYKLEYRALYLGESRATETFFEDQRARGRAVLRRVAKVVEQPGRVFDIGCGAGGMLSVFQEAGWTGVGCDHGADYLEAGRAHGLDLREGGAEVLAGEPKADLVVACHVLEHVADPIATLRGWATLLKDGGTLVVEVPGVWPEIHLGRNLARYFHIAHLHHYTLGTLASTAARAGLGFVRGDESVTAFFCRGPGLKPPVERIDALAEGLLRARSSFHRTLAKLRTRSLRRHAREEERA